MYLLVFPCIHCSQWNLGFGKPIQTTSTVFFNGKRTQNMQPRGCNIEYLPTVLWALSINPIQIVLDGIGMSILTWVYDMGAANALLSNHIALGTMVTKMTDY